MKIFKKLHRVFKLHRIFIKQDLKRLMEYKIDFATGAVGMLLAQGVNIVFLSIIFSQIPALDGWKYEEILFIYGFALLPKAIDHLFTDNLWAIAYFIIRKGDFDKPGECAVKAMQGELLALGYSCGGKRFLCGHEKADGIFGNVTEESVRSFQRSRNLPDNGIVGPKTRAALLGI